MSDLDRLLQALDWIGQVGYAATDDEAVIVALVAARRYAVGTAQQQCETHGHLPVAGSANCLFKEWGDDVGTKYDRCSFVERWVTDPPTHQREGMR